ncbi:MAG: SDR family oxidoreductase [Clostridiaceae bacterium]|nr:SDR family oxidoreductase [Clostridiaceae bacterium]
MSIAGKVVLITGASRGIGSSIAIELAKHGAIIVINYSKDDEGANKTLEAVKEVGGYGLKFKWDIASFKETHEMLKEITRTLGRIDVLVNNAGVSKIGLLMDMTEENWDDLINVNLKGVFNCSHAVIPQMLKQEKGSIINISSIWGSVGASCEVIYSASKGGVNSFTMALAKELGASGIRVNAISPGVIETEMNNFLNIEEKKQLEAEIPMRKFGKGEDVAKLVAFLAGEDSKYITGQIIKVDGGML